MFDKLKKRRGYPVEGLEGVFIRLLDHGQKKRQLAMKQATDVKRLQLRQALTAATDDAAKLKAQHDLETFETEGLFNYFTMALILVNADGVPECPLQQGESNDAYAQRAAEALADVDETAIKLIGEAYAKLKTKGEPGGDPSATQAEATQQVLAVAKN